MIVVNWVTLLVSVLCCVLQDYLQGLHELYENWLVHGTQFTRPAPVLVVYTLTIAIAPNCTSKEVRYSFEFEFCRLITAFAEMFLFTTVLYAKISIISCTALRMFKVSWCCVQILDADRSVDEMVTQYETNKTAILAGVTVWCRCCGTWYLC